MTRLFVIVTAKSETGELTPAIVGLAHIRCVTPSDDGEGCDIDLDNRSIMKTVEPFKALAKKLGAE